MKRLTRRDFLKIAATSGAGLLASGGGFSAFGTLAHAASSLGAPMEVGNPLEYYPARDWEKVYRDQYHVDSSFTYVCAPNDTHMCRFRAFTRNGVVLRTEQNYGDGNVRDIYGNGTSAHWNPRGCPKGYTLHRRLYANHRLKGPSIRKGWKEWADDGFPSLTDKPELRSKYRFDDRGNDDAMRISWDEANDYAARGLLAIAKTYSGKEGSDRFTRDGYPDEMLEHWDGAGTRTFKYGSNLPIHGAIGKFGIYRFGNVMGLLDHHVRGVPPDKARGARAWCEYTWRGDQAPGIPFVTGLQATDCDFSDLLSTGLHIQCGKNLVENKMADSHWFIELMERGGKIVSISPDYNAPAAKSDYWIRVRAGLSDTTIFLYLAHYVMEHGHVNVEFVKRFTDFPLLVRTDTLKRVKPEEVIADYKMPDLSAGPSFKIQGLTAEQRKKIGDFIVWDEGAKAPRAITRDDVGEQLAKKNINPALEWSGELTGTDGKIFKAMTIYEAYKSHLRDYDLATVAEITGSDPNLLERLARDFVTIRPVAIHIGEGINHYFHATLHNRAEFLPMMLIGEIGKHGAGVYSWAGNYKGAMLQGAKWAGHGAGVYTKEDPFAPALDPAMPANKVPMHDMMRGEEVGYWGAGDRPTIIETPHGRKVFTGHTHMPTPTKVMWYNNANLLNQAKWHYNIIENVLPKVDMIVDQQIEWTGSAEYADLILPANSWLEYEDYELGGSCSNPFIQISKGGIRPLYDSRDDAVIFAGVSTALGRLTNDKRFADYWKFIVEKKSSVYLDRILDSSTTTKTTDGRRYTVQDIMDGKYGTPGSALFLTRTYPRVPFYEQIKDSNPFYTDCGRLASYCDLPEVIDAGENFIVHREGVEATPYLPNVIISTNPMIRPNDYGISPKEVDADLRQVRNIKMPWSEAKLTTNPLWAEGYRFFCSTPKSRHSAHSSWAVVDWHMIWSANSGDPYRTDPRSAGVADREIQMNPADAASLGLEDGDYVWVDANPADRPYIGWKDEQDAFKKRSMRCMVRVTYNTSLPPNFTIMKHTGWMSTSKSVRAGETRTDGLPYLEESAYQSSYRYGSHQSITRAWSMPMHQTDTLFHKKAVAMQFTFGFDDDNHAINSAPKETLVRIVKAEAGGLGGRGAWYGAKTDLSPGRGSVNGDAYLAGALTKVKKS